MSTGRVASELKPAMPCIRTMGYGPCATGVGGGTGGAGAYVGYETTSGPASTGSSDVRLRLASPASAATVDAPPHATKNAKGMNRGSTLVRCLRVARPARGKRRKASARKGVGQRAV